MPTRECGNSTLFAPSSCQVQRCRLHRFTDTRFTCRTKTKDLLRDLWQQQHCDSSRYLSLTWTGRPYSRSNRQVLFNRQEQVAKDSCCYEKRKGARLVKGQVMLSIVGINHQNPSFAKQCTEAMRTNAAKRKTLEVNLTGWCCSCMWGPGPIGSEYQAGTHS